MHESGNDTERPDRGIPESELRTLAENYPDIVARLDRAHRHLYINPAVEQLTGISREAFAGKRIAELGFPDQAVAIWEAGLERVFAAGRSEVLDIRLSTPKGERQIESRLVPEFAPGGKLETVLAITRDVTERRLTEQALHRTSDILEKVFGSINVLLAYMDRDFNFLKVNQAYAEADQHAPEFFVGRNHFELYPNPENESLFRQVVETGEPAYFFEKPFVYAEHPERGVTYWDWTVQPVKDLSGRVEGVVLSLLNVTDKVLAKQRVEVTAEELRRSNAALQATLTELNRTQQQVIQSEKLAALGTLAAGVAHELNNPLMGVMNYVAFARKRMKDPEVAYPLERADQELKRIRELLRNMLTFARPSTGAVTSVDLATVLARTVALVAPDFRARQIGLAQEIPEALPHVLGREGRLQQIFLNLLLNARDAVEASAEKRVTLRARITDSAVAVDVQDTGVGIPEAIQGRIFDPFFTTKPPGKGTGLGLSVVQSAVSELGGTITFASRTGVGTTFTVWVPKASVEA